MLSGALLACSLGAMAQVGNAASGAGKATQGGVAQGDSLKTTPSGRTLTSAR